MKQAVICIISMMIVCPAFSYEVWMGTHLMTHTDATDLSTWSMTASKLEGFNVNRSPHDTDPATITTGERSSPSLPMQERL